jgi:hypothetical protein
VAAQRRAQPLREQPARGADADAQRGGHLVDTAPRDAREGDRLALGAVHGRELLRGRASHGGEHGAADELARRGTVRGAAQHGSGDVLGHGPVAAGGQRRAPYRIEVVADHGVRH